MSERRRLIYVSGCDDGTSVVMTLTDEEFAVIEAVAAATRGASSYTCQPVIEVQTEGDEPKHYGWPDDEPQA